MFTRSNLIVIITRHGALVWIGTSPFEGRMALFHRDVGGLVPLSFFQGSAIADYVDSVKVRVQKHVHSTEVRHLRPQRHVR